MTNMPVQCTDCARPLRDRRTPAEDAPGTVGYAGKGLCEACRSLSRRNPTPKECGSCGVALRPNRASAVERPGTVEHAAKGLCRVCYDLERNAGKAAMYPGIGDEQHAHTMAGYTAWLTERRKRGVPADGYQVEDEPDTVARLLTRRGKTPSQRRSIARLVEQLEAERAPAAASTARPGRRHRAEYGIVA